MKTALFLALAVFAAGYFVVWGSQLRAEWRAARSAAHSRAPREPATERAPSRWPDWSLLAVGAVTNFFDTLGIGSFATTTALYRLRRMVPDRLIPGTLNVGHTPPTIAQALIFIAIIAVDVGTLTAMIAAATVGAWLGAGRVARWPKRTVQLAMGAALLVAASLMTMTQLSLFPAGGDALGLSGPRLAVAVAGSVVLGALMTMGIGFYAPCMILIALLGMSPRTAFPIMMGACAFLMPVASVRFVRAGAYEPRAALGLALGGIPAVLVAAFIVKSLPLAAVRWLVVAVVLYTAAMLLGAALSDQRAPSSPPALDDAGSRA